jgi:hypothetical protein
MKIINRKFHAVLDYLSALVLIAAPWILNFSDSTSATLTAALAGILIIAMSVMTNYEGGLLRTIPMQMHLVADVILGIVLAASPWLFGFRDVVYLPHVIMGALAIFSGLLTESRSLNHGFTN